jgi:hypothetical protein
MKIGARSLQSTFYIFELLHLHIQCMFCTNTCVTHKLEFECYSHAFLYNNNQGALLITKIVVHIHSLLVHQKVSHFTVM